jgi:hypothetical protein
MGADEGARICVVPLGVGKEVTHRRCYSCLENRSADIKGAAGADPFPELSVCRSPYPNYRHSENCRQWSVNLPTV